MGKLESRFQSKLIEELEKRYPGCLIMKNDPQYIQGIPDLTILYGDRWATLECKRSAKDAHQKNQDDYVEMLDAMSFSRFIFPENKDAVLGELTTHFGVSANFDENDEAQQLE